MKSSGKDSHGVTSTTQTVDLNYQHFHVEDSGTGNVSMHCRSRLEDAAALLAALVSTTQA